MTQVKLCGLTRPEDIQIANELKPEFIGFAFWEKSKRNVSRETAQKLKKALLPEIKAVGVFVNEEVLVVAGLLNDGIIDVVQLHGTEDGEYIGRLRELAPGKEIIRAVQIKGKESLEELKAMPADEVLLPDYYLLDSGTGTRRAFNWDLIKSIEIPRPFFLAGGLDPDNVSTAIDYVKPMAVDVSSGIETDGVKDPDKMRAFVGNVRKIEE